MPTARHVDLGASRSSGYAAPQLDLEGWPAVDELERAAAAVAGPTHWPSLDQDDLQAALHDLRGWVEQLIDRFALDVRTIPPCWDRHNGMVEALTALRDYERGCYTDTASPTAAVDFIRALREITHFLKEAAALTQCSAREHRADPQRGSSPVPG